MRTAADFNSFYATPDPWRISRASFRDRALRRAISKYVSGNSVLELGCGEGHLTQAIFSHARKVTGVDLSEVAIRRAKARAIANADFKAADFLSLSFEGFDVIAAIECIYYLTAENQDAFFEKTAREHAGKILIISGPIIGKNEHREYFTHNGLLRAIAVHGATIVDFKNISARRRALSWLSRLPLFGIILDYLPESTVNQRCYIIRMM